MNLKALIVCRAFFITFKRDANDFQIYGLEGFTWGRIEKDDGMEEEHRDHPHTAIDEIPFYSHLERQNG